MDTIDSQLARHLSLACRILADAGHDNFTMGHVTVRKPGADCMHMNAHDLGLGEIEPANVLLVDFNGKVLAGAGRKHSEYPIHAEIYKLYPHINCVVHTHPFYSIIVGATDGHIKAISHEGSLFAEIPLFKKTSLLIRSPESGRSVADGLKGHRAMLMQNHGIVTVGGSIEEATVYAVLLERAAKMQVLAAMAGAVEESSAHEAAGKQGQVFYPANIKGFWEFLVRNLPPAI
jgi:L-fuculose-phosphate aldolase